VRKVIGEVKILPINTNTTNGGRRVFEIGRIGDW
jgi:hypothetical protein